MLLPAVLLGLATLCGSTALLAAPPNAGTPELNLPSWNEGASKQAIMEFVGKVTRLGGPDYVPPAERIAAFDNDGTLWAEQPLHPQLVFALDRVKALSPQHPEWTTTEPFASVVKGDIGGALAGGEPAIFQIVTATRAGLTTGDVLYRQAGRRARPRADEWVDHRRHGERLEYHVLVREALTCGIGAPKLRELTLWLGRGKLAELCRLAVSVSSSRLAHSQTASAAAAEAAERRPKDWLDGRKHTQISASPNLLLSPTALLDLHLRAIPDPMTLAVEFIAETSRAV